jgi:hypothetical protein
VNEEKFVVNDQKFAVNEQKFAVNGDKFAVNGDKFVMNEVRDLKVDKNLLMNGVRDPNIGEVLPVNGVGDLIFDKDLLINSKFVPNVDKYLLTDGARDLTGEVFPFLQPQILHVDVSAGVYVVEQIPAGVVRVLVNDEVIFAVPAPVSGERPIPGSHFKTEAARKPEPVKVAVEPNGPVTVGRPEMRKAAVLERMVRVEPLVIGWLMAEPLIVVDVRHVVHVAGGQTLRLAWLAAVASRRRRRRHPSLVRARCIVGRWWMCRPVALWRIGGQGQKERRR